MRTCRAHTERLPQPCGATVLSTTKLVSLICSNHLLETHKAHFCSVLSEVLFPTKTETRLLLMWWD